MHNKFGFKEIVLDINKKFNIVAIHSFCLTRMMK